MITLGELFRQLVLARNAGASDDSPVIIEGYDSEDNFIQACLENVTTERRCEEDGAPQGVYLNLCEIEVVA